jgi:hypothetical protein
VDSNLLAGGGHLALRAIYQIPLCVSLVFLVVQALRASASEALAYVIRHTEDSPERW